MKNKNHHILDSFIKYCDKNPEQRFWQALRNWSGFMYIWHSNGICEDRKCKDTFYIAGKNV